MFDWLIDWLIDLFHIAALRIDPNKKTFIDTKY